MAENGSTKGSSSVEAKPEDFTQEQIAQIQRERAKYWVENAARLKKRNLLTGLAIGSSSKRGARALRSVASRGIPLVTFLTFPHSDGYTFYSMPQEKFLDELENEAKEARVYYSKTSAN
ncbi:cytochrome c oxidase assembly factor 3 homolog, mitochondrial [Eleutherodactylus coqui]|uniref:cytochrome c oxidase assembly factor 3 homolog, mitochondrial n=1 Tax=Eleutherodactylus coqui TaxID=57060 RepID=UPI0034621D27